jgi:hypothetical protein
MFSYYVSSFFFAFSDLKIIGHGNPENNLESREWIWPPLTSSTYVVHLSSINTNNNLRMQREKVCVCVCVSVGETDAIVKMKRVGVEKATMKGRDSYAERCDKGTVFILSLTRLY